MIRPATLLALTICWAGGQANAHAADHVAPELAVLTAAGTPFADGDRLICFGDSITYYGDGPTGYVSLLRNAFAAAGHPTVAVISAGVGGNQVAELQARIERDVLDKDPTVVFLYIGINDSWSHRNDPPGRMAFEAGLRDLIGRIQAHGGIVVLATPTVIGEKPGRVNPLDPALDQFAASSRAVAKEMDVELCDLREIFVDYLQTHNPESKEKGILTVDGTHMNVAGDELVAQEAAKSLVAGIPRGAALPIIVGGDFVDHSVVTIAFRPLAATTGLTARYTLDGTVPTERSPAYARPIALTETTTVKVRAFRGTAAVGIAVTTVCTKLAARAADTVPNAVPGLTYAYHEGSFGRLPDFATLTAAATGIAPGPVLAVKKRDHDYALHFTGFIKVPADARYTFRLSSDDGSRLLIGDQVLLNNDGVHGAGFVQGHIPLQAGLHACTIDYFQGGGDQILDLTWSAPGLPTQPIPASAYFSAPAAK